MLLQLQQFQMQMLSSPLPEDFRFQVGLYLDLVFAKRLNLENLGLYYVPLLNPIALTIPLATSSIFPSEFRIILIGEPHKMEHVESMALVTSSSFLIASIDTMSLFRVVSFILLL